jgi:biotin carboxylase
LVSESSFFIFSYVALFFCFHLFQDFFAVDYPPITSHCCASRITAENPDEGFKPTSGKIHSVRFQSSGASEKLAPGGMEEIYPRVLGERH